MITQREGVQTELVLGTDANKIGVMPQYKIGVMPFICAARVFQYDDSSEYLACARSFKYSKRASPSTTRFLYYHFRREEIFSALVSGTTPVHIVMR